MFIRAEVFIVYIKDVRCATSLEQSCEMVLMKGLDNSNKGTEHIFMEK